MAEPMTDTPDTNTASTNNEPLYDGIAASQVVAYLQAHPDFLEQHPELFRILTPPSHHSGQGVVDLQHYMVDRLRSQIESMQADIGSILFSARDNLTAQAQIHEAVIRLLECETLRGLLHIVTGDFQRIFAVDTVRLCLEADIAPFEASDYTALRFLPTGIVDGLLGDHDIKLDNSPIDLEEIFGNATSLVSSYALLRLNLVEPNTSGVLAFGVRNKEQFQAGQGTELLRFLSRIVELSIERIWHTASRTPGNEDISDDDGSEHTPA